MSGSSQSQMLSDKLRALDPSFSSSSSTPGGLAKKRDYNSSQFTLLEELGSGSFGVVYRAIDK